MAVINLTFDDGPDPVWTPAVLDALRAAGARATFFVLAPAAAAHPGPVRRALDEGHEVQLHAHEHVRHTDLSAEEAAADRDRALEVLAGLGIRPTRWRLPWGVRAGFSEGLAAQRDLELVHWTHDTEDWRGDPAADLVARAASAADGGGIVLAHDAVGPGALRSGCAHTVAAVGPLVARARAAGVAIGPVGWAP